jgi:hypothetical protein
MTVIPVPSSRGATRLSKASLRPLALREIERLGLRQRPLWIDTGHFDRWHEIFAEAAQQACPRAAVAHFLDRAPLIADCLEPATAARNSEITLRRIRPKHLATACGKRGNP